MYRVTDGKSVERAERDEERREEAEGGNVAANNDIRAGGKSQNVSRRFPRKLAQGKPAAAFPAQHVRYGERPGGSSPWNFNQRQLLAGVARPPYVRTFLRRSGRIQFSSPSGPPTVPGPPHDPPAPARHKEERAVIHEGSLVVSWPICANPRWRTLKPGHRTLLVTRDTAPSRDYIMFALCVRTRSTPGEVWRIQSCRDSIRRTVEKLSCLVT
ncbi:hypothetical protein KM043_017406 [Ampulex compressa]|nr:hypothetical protein KM043_017406 [Ampulex compressa]